MTFARRARHETCEPLNGRDQALVEQLRQQQLELARAPVPLEVKPAPAPIPEADVAEVTAAEAEEPTPAPAPEAGAPVVVATEGEEAPPGDGSGVAEAEAEVPKTEADEVAGSARDSEESRQRRESIKNNAAQVLKVKRVAQSHHDAGLSVYWEFLVAEPRGGGRGTPLLPWSCDL